MGEASNAYRGLPIRFLFGFVGIWVVMRPLAFNLDWQEEDGSPYRTLTLYQPPKAEPSDVRRSSDGAVLSLSQLAVQPVFRSLEAQDSRPPQMLGRGKVTPLPVPFVRPVGIAKVQQAKTTAPRARMDIVPPVAASMRDASHIPFSPEPGRDGRVASSNRLRASAWVFWRAGSDGKGAAPNVLSPRYGASQVGVRLAYRPDDEGGVELYGRATAALQSRGKDAAAGIAVKPLRGANVALAVEYRQSLDDNARSGPAVMTYGGFGPSKLGDGWMAEGYGQAGVVGIEKPIAFADGSVRVKRTMASVGPVPISLGVGAWTGAQDDSARLDVGPTVDFDLKAFTKSPMRASIDWRQRVAGKAMPDSGVAVTIATDF